MDLFHDSDEASDTGEAELGLNKQYAARFEKRKQRRQKSKVPWSSRQMRLAMRPGRGCTEPTRPKNNVCKRRWRSTNRRQTKILHE